MEIINVNNDFELLLKYDQQFEQQDSYLIIDPEQGIIYCEANPEIGNGIPASLFYGRIFRIKIPSLTACSANKLMREIEPLANVIGDNFTLEWNGDNMVGVLNKHGQFALDKIAEMCERENFDEKEIAGWVDGSDWFVSDCVNHDTTDEQILSIADEQEQECANQIPPIMLLNAEETLQSLRQHKIDDLHEE